ncbi:MAG: hypothetical protein IJZ35_02195 [Clostridia bacterium]|nr:hypothetical protein [Clostridia bacterium]
MAEYTINKSSNIIHSGTGVPTAEDIELISRFARKTPDAKDIYTFTVTLCDNEVDRDCERFSLSAINAFRDMFVGVTGIFDHSMKSCDQTARIYKTQVITDSVRTTSCGEPYTYLKAWCYMLRAEKNASLIEEIDAGIKKEVSISCSVKSRICSVCGKDMRTHDCPHTQSETVNGKVCHAILTDAADAYEWSFVAVPAQRNAGVSKSAKKPENDYTTIDAHSGEEIAKSICNITAKDCVALSQAQLKALAGYLAEKESLADIGTQHRKAAEKETVALCAFTLPDANTEMLGKILKKLDSNEVFMLRKAFELKAEAADAFAPVFAGEKANICDNSEFRI